MRVLVTGSEGTIGRPLVAQLRSQGHDVLGCDLKHSADVRVDVSEYRQLKRIADEYSFDRVYHLAAEFGRVNGMDHYENMWRTNVIGTRNVIELFDNIIFASSSEVYGERGDELLEEGWRYGKCYNDYAISKIANEFQFRQCSKKWMIFRFCNSYGPSERYSPYRSVICKFLHERKVVAYEDAARCFLYMDDLIAGLTSAFLPGEVINLAGPELVSIPRLVNIIQKYRDLDVTWRTAEFGNVAVKNILIDKARLLLDWEPQIYIDEGIRMTWEAL